jgi:hypothetical protein
MFNIRLPTNSDADVDFSKTVNLNQTFLENGALVTRSTDMIYSRGVLFFFIDRRSNMMKFEQLPLFSPNRLPVAISGFERINSTGVIVPPSFSHRNETYSLRSVIVAETNGLNTSDNYVIGSSAMVRKLATDGSQDVYYYYRAMKPMQSDSGLIVPCGDIDIQEFTAIAKTRGLVFMYDSSTEDAGKPLYW